LVEFTLCGAEDRICWVPVSIWPVFGFYCCWTISMWCCLVLSSGVYYVYGGATFYFL